MMMTFEADIDVEYGNNDCGDSEKDGAAADVDMNDDDDRLY